MWAICCLTVFKYIKFDYSFLFVAITQFIVQLFRCLWKQLVRWNSRNNWKLLEFRKPVPVREFLWRNHTFIHGFFERPWMFGCFAKQLIKIYSKGSRVTFILKIFEHLVQWYWRRTTKDWSFQKCRYNINYWKQ